MTPRPDPTRPPVEPLRVLLVHNHYGSREPSGENLVFELERRLLEDRGHPVETLERHSDEIRDQGVRGLVRGALSTPYNVAARASIREAARRFRPDIVHAHNTFPLLSPAVFGAVPPPAGRVLTLHNYRLFCAAGAPMRNGRVCTECLDRKSALPSIRYGCYRGSRLATMPVAAGVELHRRLGTWRRHVEAFVALTDFQRAIMVDAGLPAAKVKVKPNFFPGDPGVVSWEERRERAVFVGRLSEEKGVRTLVESWDAWGSGAPDLLLLGDGPLRRELEERVTASGARVRFAGLVTPAEAQAAIGSSRLLVVPSIWFEGFPMVIREALALGTPSVVSDLGALPELVGHGRAGAACAPGDPDALLAAVRGLWGDPARLEAMSAAARREHDAKYTEGANYRQLIEIYRFARDQRASGGSGVHVPPAISPASTNET